MKGGVLSGLDNRLGKVIASKAIQRIKEMPGKPQPLGIKTTMTIPDTAHASPLVSRRGRKITAQDSSWVCLR